MVDEGGLAEIEQWHAMRVPHHIAIPQHVRWPDCSAQGSRLRLPSFGLSIWIAGKAEHKKRRAKDGRNPQASGSVSRHTAATTKTARV
ncbi:MAG TPA: hypothetical protein VMB48_08880, partial [Steroidobacteraceae bacterium]|nr:hypothetical protein [Steroidobacteraceae bacterium]